MYEIDKEYILDVGYEYKTGNYQTFKDVLCVCIGNALEFDTLTIIDDRFDLTVGKNTFEVYHNDHALQERLRSVSTLPDWF